MMELKGIILKQGMPTASDNPKERHQPGSYIRVSPAEYARLVPRYAHDAADYLAADKARKEVYAKTKDGKAALKLQKAEREYRRANALAIKAARKKAAEAAKAQADAEAERRLAAIEQRMKDVEAAEKRAANAAKKAADPTDGNK
jgi:hypothetical protein